MDARGKFGEYEKCVRVAWGAAESNSSFLSALQTSQVHPELVYAQLKAWANSFITERQQAPQEEAFYCDKVQNSHNAK